MNDLFEDLCDGTKLLTLLELFTGKKMVRGERQRDSEAERQRRRDRERDRERGGDVFIY